MLLLAEDDAARSQSTTLLSLSGKALHNVTLHANSVQEERREKGNSLSESLEIAHQA